MKIWATGVKPVIKIAAILSDMVGCNVAILDNKTDCVEDKANEDIRRER